jgi:hypothetical protein
LAKLLKDGNVVSFEMRDLMVTVVDPTHATVLGTAFIVTKAERLSSRAEYKLEKRDGRWLIVSTDRKSP